MAGFEPTEPQPLPTLNNMCLLFTVEKKKIQKRGRKWSFYRTLIYLFSIFSQSGHSVSLSFLIVSFLELMIPIKIN